MHYTEDRIAAVEFEGRKYRSNMLLQKARTDSLERDRLVRAGMEVLTKDTGRALGRIIFVFEIILFLGLIGLLDMDKGYMPSWLSIALIILGGVGFILVVRLRDRLRREAVYEASIGKKEKEKIEREAAADRAQEDAAWQRIISQPGIQPHEAGMQYEAFLKERFDAKEKRWKRADRWRMALGWSLALGLLTALWGYMVWWSDLGSNSILVFWAHAAGLVLCLILAIANWPRREGAADTLGQVDTPHEVPPASDLSSEASPDLDVVRRAAHVNQFWRLGGAGERVPFARCFPPL